MLSNYTRVPVVFDDFNMLCRSLCQSLAQSIADTLGHATYSIIVFEESQAGQGTRPAYQHPCNILLLSHRSMPGWTTPGPVEQSSSPDS